MNNQRYIQTRIKNYGDLQVNHDIYRHESTEVDSLAYLSDG